MTFAQAAQATGGSASGAPGEFTGVSTDSRAIAAGQLFVALVGERFDGHDYARDAAGRGAAGALVSRRLEIDLPQVLVQDTRLALGALAADWRGRFALPVVALTGSNGKTTVKEMLASILAVHCDGRDKVLATEGNLNNDIGMPLTLLGLREQHHYAVVEMGMNHAGEIAYLAGLARPTVALVTNAHRAHVGLLGSVEAIARAKGEIYAGLRGGVALVNADDQFASYWKGLNAGASDRRTVTFGMGEHADVRGSLVANQLRLVTPTDAFALTLQVAGEHNARNAIAACAAAFALEIAPRAIQSGLAAFAGVPGRQQRLRTAGGALVIDDTYNANPESMKAALRVLAAAGGRRAFVMGDMGELGEGEAQMHAEIGAYAKGLGIDALLAVGPASVHAAEAFGPGGQHFADLERLVQAAGGEAASAATILVKGSRFMRMERVVARLAPAASANSADKDHRDAA